ncbi:tyrosine-type recombinase/integrase [Marimonas lutisalis]|uniref:tyrosine-type recombinase/integrase n=1 Tax=Marimonas lutisalis TaxID=2545756 RepID=UPI0010F6934A|nr:site-specific integrase [Marimonas lutisalis]
MAKLTAASVERIKPTEKRQEIPDALMPGLYLVVQTSGKRSWQVRYRAAGVHRRMTLGRYPLVGLAEAREKAADALRAAQDGGDPAADQKAAKASRLSSDNTVRSQIDTYHKRHLKTLKTGNAVMQSLQFNVVPVWGDRDVTDISRRDIVLLLDSIVDDGRATTANRVKAYLSKFFGWCEDRGVIEQSPAIGLKLPAKEKSRDRPLNNGEIRLFWLACDMEPAPWGALFKILLLTGQRSGEVARMQWGDIDGEGVWRLSTTKNDERHDVPLPQAAKDIIDAQPRLGPYVFTTRGDTPALSTSKPAARIASRMSTIASEEAGEPVTVPHWRPHDLRHTVKTGLASLGVSLEIRSRATNHLSDIPPMDRRYNHYDFTEEKRRALDAWSRLVMDIVEGGSGNVVRLTGERSNA